MERHRTGGMTAIAVLNIVVGGIEGLAGLSQLPRALVWMREEWGEITFAIPAGLAAFALLTLAAGVVGIIAGIGMLRLRPWARRLSLEFGALLIAVAAGLLMLVSVFTPFILPVMSIGTSILGEPTSDNLLLLFATGIYMGLPVCYAFVVWLVFSRPAWRAAFARTSSPR